MILKHARCGGADTPDLMGCECASKADHGSASNFDLVMGVACGSASARKESGPKRELKEISPPCPPKARPPSQTPHHDRDRFADRINRWSSGMTGAREDNERRAGPKKPLSRSEAEAAWLRGSVQVSSTHMPVVPARAERDQRIREAAYFNAERRGFAPGHELEDWLVAEAVLDV